MTKWICILLAGVALNAQAADVSGHWRVAYAGLKGTGPKTVGSIELNLKNDGPAVTGTVTIGSWPGEAPVADAKVEGNHLIFFATGYLNSTTGIPTCRIDATVDGDAMTLLLTVVKNAGGPLGANDVYEYQGTRTAR